MVFCRLIHGMCLEKGRRRMVSYQLLDFPKREDVLVSRRAKGFSFFVLWAEFMPCEDRSAIGCYLTTYRRRWVIVNLKRICIAASKLTNGQENSLIPTMLHLSDLSLIHELTHWASSDDSHHMSWSHFVFERLIFPFCTEE